MKVLVKVFSALTIILLFTSNCDKDRGFIIMPISQEVKLGEQLDSAILVTPSKYPILNKSIEN